MVKIYQRHRQRVEEVAEYQANLIQFLYQSKRGQKLLPIVTHPWFSTIYVLADYLPTSQKKIQAFVDNYQMDLSLYEKQTYQHYAAFFQRKLTPKALSLVSPPDILAVAQAKLLVLPISKDLGLTIKGQHYQLEALLQDATLAQAFVGGMLCVYRLGLEDYHRYLVAESGTIVAEKQIKGKLHSVRDMVHSKFAIFKENKRSYTIIETEDGQRVMQMEIGALLVGKINNHPRVQLESGQEKGYFSLGGSTILVAYPAQTLQFDQDILYYSNLGIETQVQIGERIGVHHA